MVPPAGEDVNGSLGGGPLPGRGLACANCQTSGAAWHKQAVAADVEGASRGGGACSWGGGRSEKSLTLGWNRGALRTSREGGPVRGGPGPGW